MSAEEHDAADDAICANRNMVPIDKCAGVEPTGTMGHDTDH
jgi:hypothetical protein